MTGPDAERAIDRAVDRAVDRADGSMNRIAKGGPVAAIVIVLAAILMGGWLVGLRRG